LSLGFVAADDSDDLLRVTLGHLRRALLLSLCAYRHGGDHQNGNNQPQVHEYLLAYVACDDGA
jgi:hypothetical protein